MYKKKTLDQPSFVMLIVVSLTILVLDQITKYAILTKIPLYESISIVPGFLRLVHLHNPGGMFGFMSQSSPVIRNFLFIGVSFVAVIFVIYFYTSLQKSYKLLSFSLTLIVGGALGNLFDRIRFGKVIDFIDVSILNYHWPAFNVADSAITTGTLILTLHIIYGKMPD